MSAFPSQLHALLEPRGYPHPVRAVELIETHVSWVLLTGELAYKIKRPVHYCFVNLRAPEYFIERRTTRGRAPPPAPTIYALATVPRGNGI